MKIYEEFDNPSDKRKAQRGASRGVATGKATGYVLVFNEDGIQRQGANYVYEALGELMSHDGPGSLPNTITYVTPSVDYLREKCRVVGWDTIPEVWKRAFGRKLKDMLRVYEDSPDEMKKYRRRYRKVTKWAA